MKLKMGRSRTSTRTKLRERVIKKHKKEKTEIRDK
jgi:hypothetical protein